MNISTAVKAFTKAPQVVKINLAATKLLKPAINVAQKHGPEILTGVGIAGGVASTILAARATLKLEDVIDRTAADIDFAQSNLADNDAELKRTTLRIKVRGAADIAKLYVPAASIGIASIGCVLGAHGIMKRRNVALIAAYNTLEKSFAAYRKRVVDEFGEQKDSDYRHGVYEDKIKDEETGKTKTVARIDPNGISQYAKFFDEGNENYQKTRDYNFMFLRMQQNWANDKLRIRGNLFLNEVYDALGLPRTKEGAVVGWSMKGDGDKFVDFNIYDFDSPRARAFVNGEEKSILLDFNVDGVILDNL